MISFDWLSRATISFDWLKQCTLGPVSEPGPDCSVIRVWLRIVCVCVCVCLACVRLCVCSLLHQDPEACFHHHVLLRVMSMTLKCPALVCIDRLPSPPLLHFQTNISFPRLPSHLHMYPQ